MIKKFTSFFLILIMILTSTVTVYAYEPEPDYYGHWAENTITEWLDKGYIKGYPDGSFKPEAFVTRAEFIKIINSLLGYNDKSEIFFTDVTKDHWYYEEIQKAYKAGILSWISTNEFLPDSYITREESVVIASEALKLAPSSSKLKFNDSSDISHWAFDSVSAAVQEGIINGYESNCFYPQHPVKRAEAVEILNRTLQKFNSSDLVITDAGTEIENRTVRNLHITKDVGEGEVTLKNVTITGKLFVEGGGENSIRIVDSSVNQLVASKANGTIRFLFEGKSNVESASIKSDVIIEQNKFKNGGLERISMYAGSSISLQADKKTRLLSNDKSVASIKSGSTIYAENPGIAVISYTTAGKKNEICEIEVKDPSKETIKILSIGNSFSQDTLFYLYEIAQSAQINIIVGNLYSSGCSLERHLNYAINNEKAYTYYKWSNEGMTALSSSTMKSVLTDEKWDYITFQQSSGNSGIYSTYQPYLNELINYVYKTASNPEVQFALNMTWSYSSRSIKEDFIHYNYNQKTMYNSIVDSYRQAVDETNIDILIPCGTAIQNARTNKYLKAIGNELTSDGYHLNAEVGRYIAGLTVFESIMKEKNIDKNLYDDVKFCPITGESTKNLIKLSKSAAINAIENPFSIQTIK